MITDEQADNIARSAFAIHPETAELFLNPKSGCKVVVNPAMDSLDKFRVTLGISDESVSKAGKLKIIATCIIHPKLASFFIETATKPIFMLP